MEIRKKLPKRVKIFPGSNLGFQGSDTAVFRRWPYHVLGSLLLPTAVHPLSHACFGWFFTKSYKIRG